VIANGGCQEQATAMCLFNDVSILTFMIVENVLVMLCTPLNVCLHVCDSKSHGKKW